MTAEDNFFWTFEQAVFSVREIGVFTAGSGMGKTYALRCFMNGLNPISTRRSISASLPLA